MTSEYEKIRIKNIADNKKVLAQLGLLNPFKDLPKLTKKSFTTKRKRASSPVEVRKRQKTENLEGYGSVYGTRRKSSRLQGKPAAAVGDLPDDADISVCTEEEDSYTPVKRAVPNRPNVYGAIPDVPVGRLWATRLECNFDGIHRPTVAGIHAGPDGAYSIALSGGYEDDIDLGTCFTYTGEGGRDLKGTAANPKNLRTAAQSKDQSLSRGNLALSRNVETGEPVRVLRGYKLRSIFAPDEGYRYDGLYKVEKHWYTIGLSGFSVFKFALKRMEDQSPPPWEFQDEQDSSDENKGEKSELLASQDSGMGSDTASDGAENKEEIKEENNNIEKMDDKNLTEKPENTEENETSVNIDKNKQMEKPEINKDTVNIDKNHLTEKPEINKKNDTSVNSDINESGNVTNSE